MPIRLSAKDFQAQFGSSIGNQVVNKTASEPITKEGKPAKKQKAQIRIPKKRQPNKLEAEWMMICEQEERKPIAVLFEPFALRLPSGAVYSPDVVVIERVDVGIGITCYECKGEYLHGNSARSILAFKEAKAAFPFFEFVFVQRRDGEWLTAE